VAWFYSAVRTPQKVGTIDNLAAFYLMQFKVRFSRWIVVVRDVGAAIGTIRSTERYRRPFYLLDIFLADGAFVGLLLTHFPNLPQVRLYLEQGSPETEKEMWDLTVILVSVISPPDTSARSIRTR
jgi:hypothetical protein